MFGRLKKAGVKESLINDINDGDEFQYQEEVVVSAQVLAREALRQSGFTHTEAHSDVVTAAVTYAVNIAFAELRCDGQLRRDLATQAIGVMNQLDPSRHEHPHMQIRRRMGLPGPEPADPLLEK